MQTRTNPRAILLLTALAASAAWAARDPFLPIDYAPAPPPSETPAEPEIPAVAPAAPAPVLPTVKPITAAEWAAARKALKISGITKSVIPDTGKTVIQAMINRQTYAVGDTVPFVHEDVRFQWRVESLVEQEAVLAPLKAERLAPKPNDLRNNQ
jgi:hypothetical protein